MESDQKFERVCPSCSKVLTHTQKHNRDNAQKKNRVCSSCSRTKFPNEPLIRNCLKCNKEIKYARASDKRVADKFKSVCKKCATTPVQFKSGVGCKVLAEHSIPKYDLDFLINENIKSYYFLGLIISDGSFYKNTFEITLKKEDSYILEELSILTKGAPISSKYVNGTEYKRLSFNNKKSIGVVMKHFNFHYNKTYHPLDFENFNNIEYNKLFIMFIGILDGDGSIYIDKNGRTPGITLTFHKVWEEFYKALFGKLNIFYSKSNKDNCVVFAINRTLEIIKIRDLKNQMKIKGLSRKWNKLNNLKINEKIKNSYRY